MEDDVLTIMFVRKSGKIRSIKLEVKKIVYLGIGVLSLIIAFIGLIYGYYLIYSENSELLAMVEKKEHVLAQSSAREFSQEKTDEANIGKEVAGPDIKEKEAQIQSGKEPEKKLVENIRGELIVSFSADSDSNQVAIRDFRIEKNDNGPGIKAVFNIINVNHISKITGYWIMVGERKKNKMVYKSYPETLINSKGEIVNHKNAKAVTWFSIERLKPVKGILEFDNEFDDYERIYIHVYSIKGELLLRSIYNRWELAA